MLVASLSFADAANWTLPQLLERRVEETPDAVGIIDATGSLTYRDWLQAAKGVSAALVEHSGIEPGDRVLVWLPNGDAMSFARVFHGGLDSGSIVVPADDRLPGPELRALLAETRIRAAVISPTILRGLSRAGLESLGVPEGFTSGDSETELLVPVEGDRLLFDRALALEPEIIAAGRIDAASRAKDPGACSFLGLTSGSTGRPKGVMVGHGATVQLAERMVNDVFVKPRGGRPVDSTDVIQSPIPGYLTTSIVNNLYPAVLAGCPLVYERRRFDPEYSESRMVSAGTTIYSGGPAHFAMICRLPETQDSKDMNVEVMITAGAPMNRDLYMSMRARWPRTAIANWFATNETLTGQTLNIGEDLDREPASVGRAIWPTEIRIADDEGSPLADGEEGELLMRAEGQMLGYFSPEATTVTAADWVGTGDRGYIDADGLLRIVGRTKERINRGGFKFYPIDVEQVLNQSPLVVESAVVGVPHPEFGQDAVAFVVLRDPAGEHYEVERELRDFCRERVARNKVPSRVIIVPALPRGGYAKVQKTELLKLLAEKPQVEGGVGIR